MRPGSTAVYESAAFGSARPSRAARRASAAAAYRACGRASIRPRRRRSAGILRKLALVAALALAIFAVRTAFSPSFSSHLEQIIPPASTPVSEWKQGTVPNLYQIDPAWADTPYADGKLGETGCGPTCLTMAYVALTGKTDLDPAGMARMSEEGGHTMDGMTAWSLMTDGAAALGLSSEELPADAGSVRGALEAGKVIICSVRPGDFTTTGHFIVLAGLDESGQVLVRDPNSAERSNRAWDLERVLSQCKGIWALSA